MNELYRSQVNSGCNSRNYVTCGLTWRGWGTTGGVTPPVIQSVTGSVTDSVIWLVTQGLTDPVTGSVTEAMTEAVNWAVTGAMTGSVTEAVSGCVTDGITDSVTERVTGSVTRGVLPEGVPLRLTIRSSILRRTDQTRRKYAKERRIGTGRELRGQVRP